MPKIKTIFKSLETPIIILLFGSLAYLTQINGWGFYKDDWHLIWAGHTQGLSGIIQLFTLDRPFMGVLYAITYKFLGESVLFWQLFAFLVRMLSALSFWWLVKMIWKDRRHLVLVMSVVFILYPGFLQQPNANTFQNHFIGFTAAIVSIGLSIQSVLTTNKTLKIFSVICSMALALFYLLIYEYMIGLEMVRLILLDYVLQNSSFFPIKQRIIRIIKTSIPYIGIILIFLVWRFIIFNSTRAATDPNLIASMYLSNPGLMILRLFLESIKDILAVMVSAWTVPFYQLTENLNYQTLFKATLIGFIGIITWIVVTSKIVTTEEREKHKPNPDSIFLFCFGTLLAFVTLIPILIANRDVNFANQFDRYTLQATIGVGIAFGGLFELIKQFKIRNLIIAGFIGLSLITHLSNGVYYENFWKEQQKLWWQLTWRAPGIEPATTIIPILQGNYFLAEGYEIWGPANRIYFPNEKNIILSGEVLNSDTLTLIQSQYKYGKVFRTFDYVVDFSRSLIVSLPGNGSCLHVLGGEILEISGNETAGARLLAPISKPQLITPFQPGVTPPKEIFGSEPPHDWCYFYQKISLERQKKDWNSAVKLANEALALDLEPMDPSEWMPLYESYFYFGDMDKVNEIGGILRATPEFILPYCSQFDGQKIDEINQDSDLSFLIFNICPELMEND